MPHVFVKTVFEDIRFKCQRCGSCCHHKRPQEFDDLIPMERLHEFVEKSNLIYPTEKDVSAISKITGRRPAEFIDTLYEYDGCFVKVEDKGDKIILDLPVMKSREDTTCVLYKDGCTVYPVRPIACRLFPFRVEEETTPAGDVLLNISYNPTCPGIGKGLKVDRKKLEKLVVEQFLHRTQEITFRVQKMRASGAISGNARVYRTLPGRRAEEPAL